jgi:hypothetical protein
MGEGCSVIECIAGANVLWHVNVREKSDLVKKSDLKEKKKKAYIILGPKIILPSENGV